MAKEIQTHNSFIDRDERARSKVLRRFSMFDGTGTDLRQCESYEEAIATAGLDYKVEKAPIYLADGTEVKDNFCVLKKDDMAQLGIVGKDYKPVGNVDAFEVAQELYESGNMRFEAGGPSIGARNTTDYAKSFMVMRGDDIRLGSDDTSEVYNSFIFFRNSFNGATGIQYRIVLQRLVCLNGMTRYLGGKKNQFFINIQHSNNAMDKIRIARDALIKKDEEIKAIQREIEAFCAIPFTKDQFDKEIIPLVLKTMKLKPLEIDESEVAPTEIEKRDLTIQRLWNAYQADDTQNYNNTAYKVILAMSDMETHASPFRDTKNPSLYMDRVLQGMVWTTAVANYIAQTRGIKVNN